MDKNTEFRFTVPHGFGYYDYFAFMHLRPAKSDKKRMCCINSETYSCREFFIRSMRHKITGTDGGIYKDMRLDRTYVGVGTVTSTSKVSYEKLQKDQLSRLERSLAILNALESTVRWPRTKMFSLVSTNGHFVPCVMFIGAQRWNKSPYLMSLFTLIIRAGHRDWMPETIKGKTWDEMLPIITKATGFTNDTDREWVRSGIKYWQAILTNYKELFGYRDRAWQWSLDRVNHTAFSSMEGIYKLTSGETAFHELYEKFKEIKKGVDKNGGKASKS